MTLTMKGASIVEGERIIEPLLYIDQPILQKPKAYMQDHYKTAKDLKKETPSSQEEEQNHTGHAEGESFNQLTIKEKIKYLVNLPSEVPNIKCEIVTDENRYRGILLEEKDDDVVLRIFGRENVTLKKELITNIRMIGF